MVKWTRKYLEERLAEERKRRDFISSGIPNRITKGEEELASEWWLNHKCFNDIKTWENLIELQCYKPNLKFGQTSIGSTIILICPYCDEEKDVTDYGLW